MQDVCQAWAQLVTSWDCVCPMPTDISSSSSSCLKLSEGLKSQGIRSLNCAKFFLEILSKSCPGPGGPGVPPNAPLPDRSQYTKSSISYSSPHKCSFPPLPRHPCALISSSAPGNVFLPLPLSLRALIHSWRSPTYIEHAPHLPSHLW